ncbi:E3 ubiquitin-protein ligase synoviolin [Nematocida major]|uniref:E3 ubiquitin-protein ligase synoviolin n=1 Tax=Nematocida major TaxID=1912982 RepID=UPI002008E190|nr:E3 ubiquitin-protein ligase synoviolin [Nematocida major]KAH9386431.1 E3 ubiquitin-protein ligase synoviolin [Nematocida major]
MNMYRHETYLAIYFTILCGICVNDFVKGKSLYECLVGMVEKRVQHFFLSLFLVGALYVLGKALVDVTIGELAPLEKEGVQENSMRYFGSILLAVTLFADNITVRTSVLFAFVFGVKVLHWIMGFRIEAMEKSGALYLRMERVTILALVLFTADLLLAYRFISSALSTPSISILFGFEFFVMFAYSIRSLYALGVLYLVKDKESGIEDRIFLIFYGDFVFCLLKILAHALCLIWTSVHFKMPINLLRDGIFAIKHLIVRTKSMLAYRSLVVFLEGCPDASEAEVEENKTCLICHEDMKVGKKLECAHIFHLACLKEWLHRQQACPVCRKVVAPKRAEPGPTPTSTPSSEESRAEGVSSVLQMALGSQNGDEYEGVPVMVLENEQP